MPAIMKWALAFAAACLVSVLIQFERPRSRAGWHEGLFSDVGSVPERGVPALA